MTAKRDGMTGETEDKIDAKTANGGFAVGEYSKHTLAKGTTCSYSHKGLRLI